jgi:hypothetical protein
MSRAKTQQEHSNNYQQTLWYPNGQWNWSCQLSIAKHCTADGCVNVGVTGAASSVGVTGTVFKETPELPADAGFSSVGGASSSSAGLSATQHGTAQPRGNTKTATQ